MVIARGHDVQPTVSVDIGQGGGGEEPVGAAVDTGRTEQRRPFPVRAQQITVRAVEHDDAAVHGSHDDVGPARPPICPMAGEDWIATAPIDLRHNGE